MHIKYWIGLYIKEYFPDMARGPHAELISPYFSHMKSLLVGGIVLEDIDISKLKKTSPKTLYASFTSTFPPPKIVFKFDADWLQVWQRLQSPMLEPKAREILFMVVNNIIAITEIDCSTSLTRQQLPIVLHVELFKTMCTYFVNAS